MKMKLLDSKVKKNTVDVSKQRKSKKKKKKLSTASQQSLDKIICAKCRKPLAGVGEVRLQPRPKLTAHMQKLLQKRRKNENSLTERQQELLKRSMQQCNILELKCTPCNWKSEETLVKRQGIQNQKAYIKQRLEAEKQTINCATQEVLDKQTLKKKKKKERKKKAAEAKMIDLNLMKRPATKPSPSLASHTVLASPAQHMPATPAARRKDMMQLRRVLNAQKKGRSSARESLSHFLNSLK